MARMIPAFMDEQTPPGEADLFHLLRDCPDSWIVFHSLDLSPCNNSLRTEIDFLVVIPDTGILCLEVKSHENLTFDGVKWHPATIKRSPFKQAADGTYAFYRRMRDLAPQFTRVPVAQCCVFPRSRFRVSPNLSVAEHEVIDSHTFRSYRDSTNLSQDLRRRLSISIRADANLKELHTKLDADDLETLVRLCLPVQKRRPDLREEIEQRELEAERALREQQKPVLLLSHLNERTLVTGGAGTGKTLIAIELAQRVAKNGKRVGLFCFNRLAGEWLSARTAESMNLMPNLVTGPAVRVLVRLLSVPMPLDPTIDFWNEELPKLVDRKLEDEQLRAAASFDYLVVDEAQDIMARPWIWSALLKLLDGGVRDGAYVLLGDFTYQALSAPSQVEGELNTIHQIARPAKWHLSENCRNYPAVGDAAVRLGGIRQRIYSGFLRKGGSARSYDIFFYETTASQIDQLEYWINEFKGAGYKAAEITLLSFSSARTSAGATLAENGYPLYPAWTTENSTTYTSIHAYKGLENKVVILTDLDGGRIGTSVRQLLYTGITRATEAVRILCSADVQNWFLDLLTN